MSGSPGASDEANRVVYACLAALDLLEAGGEPLREKYPATGGLAAAFGESLDLDEAFAASAEAIALSPACTARHAHNYYQVAASLYLRAGELDYATAALWPVSAGDDTPRAARMVDAGFRALFTASPIKRIGRNRFLRNVLIGIGNSGDASVLPKVIPLLEDESELVRVAAGWVAARLGKSPPQLIVTNQGTYP